MGKIAERRRRNPGLFTVTVTCRLTPPFDFIGETQHKTYAAAVAAAEKAHRKFKGTPHLHVAITLPATQEPGAKKTAWERILAV